jgi:hypothetical protein
MHGKYGRDDVSVAPEALSESGELTNIIDDRSVALYKDRHLFAEATIRYRGRWDLGETKAFVLKGFYGILSFMP